MSDGPMNVPTNITEPTSRRSWLLEILVAAVGLTGAAILYPIVRFLWPRKVTSSGTQSVVAPYRAHQLRLGAEGQWCAPFNFGGKPCLLALTKEGLAKQARGAALTTDDVRAFNATCTHTDCTVQFEPNEHRIFCACHNGVYDLNGQNVSGPPPRPLETYRVDFRGEAGREEIIVSQS